MNIREKITYVSPACGAHIINKTNWEKHEAVQNFTLSTITNHHEMFVTQQLKLPKNKLNAGNNDQTININVSENQIFQILIIT